MGYLWDEGMEWLQPKDYVFNKKTGRERNLSKSGSIEGFRAGDRVEYTDACYPKLRGRRATIVGFDSERTIWTQTDGYGTACHSTPAHAAKITFKKVSAKSS